MLKARMNPDLHMAGELKTTASANLFVIFGEPDIEIEDTGDKKMRVRVKGVDVFKPQTGEVVSVQIKPCRHLGDATPYRNPRDKMSLLFFVF